MKLAEALSQRADLQRRIDGMGARMKAASRVQEGDMPPENADSLLKELQGCLDQLEQLIVRINKTNQLTTMPDGQTITQKLAHRDVLKKHVSMMQGFMDYLLDRTDRYSRQEIKYVNTVDVNAMRILTDKLAEQLRLSDVELQSINWSVDLM